MLPIELISFKGNCFSDKKEITWETASETNNDFYTLEHSKDATEFTEIARENGAGTTTIHHYYSKLISEEENDFSYYRLQQTDYDGRFRYSDILFLNCLNNKPDYSTIKLFPNPSSNQLNINFGFSIDGDYKLLVRNVLGQEIKMIDYSKNRSEDIHFFIDDLPNGIYFLKIVDVSNKGDVPILKFVVEK